MSIGKIALGVFLGNLMCGVIAWRVLSVALDHAETQSSVAQADADYSALRASNR
jgi:hypothetical protein